MFSREENPLRVLLDSGSWAGMTETRWQRILLPRSGLVGMTKTSREIDQLEILAEYQRSQLSEDGQSTVSEKCSSPRASYEAVFGLH